VAQDINHYLSAAPSSSTGLGGEPVVAGAAEGVTYLAGDMFMLALPGAVIGAFVGWVTGNIKKGATIGAGVGAAAGIAVYIEAKASS